MKRILIYVYNEEIAPLKELALRLAKKGALVNFHSLKYREVVKADQILTLPKHLTLVKDIFHGTNIPVAEIEDESINSEKPKREEVQDEAPVVVLEPIVEEAPVVVPDDDTVVISVGELETNPTKLTVDLEEVTKTPRRRSRSSN